MSSQKISGIFFITGVIAGLVLAGCAQPVTPAEAPPTATATLVATEISLPSEVIPPTTAPAPTVPHPPAEKKIATLIWAQEFDTLSPLYTNMWFVTTLFPIYLCQAWWFDDQADPNPVPNLVIEIPSKENGGISEDNRTITLKLRDDIRWSDGTPITSADFKFTYDMVMSDRNAVNSRSPYDLLETLQTPNERTVVATFNKPYAPWLVQLFSGTVNSIIPAHILQPVFDAEGTIDTAEWNKAPTVGCGPFNFAGWESGSYARFVANENYWLGRPKLDEIFLRFVPDDASQIAALIAGDGDLGTFFAASDLPQLEEAGIKTIVTNSGFHEGIFFNMHPEKSHLALRDVKVRQAIALGLNRQKLVNDLTLGRFELSATLWDKTHWVDPSITPWPYDPEKAKQLLDEAGWVDSNSDGTRDKDGVELVLKYGTTTREIRQEAQAVAQQDLAQLGITLDLQSFDPDIFFAGYADGGLVSTFAMDISEYSESPSFPDPDILTWRCGEIPSDENPAGMNVSGMCDEELDALFAQQETQVDFTERQATFFQITKQIFENVYWLGLWNDPNVFGISTRLQNVRISGATPFYNVMEWDLIR